MDDQHQSALDPSVLAKLRAVRRLLRRYVAAETLFLLVGWFLLVFWIGGLVDYLPARWGASEMPRPARMVMLLIMAGGILWILLRWAGPRLWIRVPDKSIALLIEKHYPHLNNELVTAVELAADADAPSVADRVSNPQAYLAMLDRVRRDLVGRMRQVEPTTVFNWQPLWTLGVGVAFALVSSGVVALANYRWVTHWGTRLFALSDEPWPRRAELRAEGIGLSLPPFTGQLTADRVLLPFADGIVRVPAGASVELRVLARTDDKVVPEVCTVYYRGDDGTRGRANMRRVGKPREGWQAFVLDGPPLENLTAAMTIDVVGLDARLRNLRLELVDPAVVTDLRVEVTYPPYLLKTLERPPVEALRYRTGMQLPEGAQVRLLGGASDRLDQVQYVIRTADQDPTQGLLSIQSVEPERERFIIDMGTMETSSVAELRLIDQHGLAAKPLPRYLLPVQEDQVPAVDTQLAGIGSAITPIAVLPVRGTVEDDYGIATVGIELTTEAGAFELAVPGDSVVGDELVIDIDLQQLQERGQLVLDPGQTLNVSVTAQDYYDLDAQQTHVGRGLPQQLNVVTADQLLVVLDREELQLRQRLEQIIFELEQLRDVLDRLASVGESAQHWLPPHNRRFAGSTFRSMPPLHLVSWQEPSAAEGERERQLNVVRAQQSVLQADKSRQELIGLATGIDNVRLQLVHNRIDSVDRQQRLLEGIYRPLQALLEEEFRALQADLMELQSAAMSGNPRPAAVAARQALDVVLAGLQQIKQKMLDIESFNEIVDLVRDLLEQQQQLLDETERAQRASILDILK
ncbi:MAG: polyketide synthase [Pirellulaceae bacterium]|nr:MAG: polyketide synthase [Pirellulaceae bacterium]